MEIGGANLTEFECPHCGAMIDEEYVFLKGAQSQYGNVEKEYESGKYLITKVSASGDSKYFVFRKDKEHFTQKWSFRLRNPDKVLKQNFDQLDEKDKILYTSEGMRIGKLTEDYPEKINSKLIKKSLSGAK